MNGASDISEEITADLCFMENSLKSFSAEYVQGFA
jgi:hypothetical protein